MDDVASSSAQIQAPAKAKKVTEALKIPPTVQERWRDATVASLSLLPPAAVASSASVQDALTLSRAHNGQCVLIVDDAHVRGFVDLIDLVAHETQGSPDDAVAEIQRSFGDAPSTFPATFRVIHTATPLAEVAVFLETAPMALVTDEACTQIVHVVTQGDLTRYADRMGIDMRPSALGSRVEEESSRDRSLADVLRLLDGYAPLIPDEVSDYYLERAGFQCDDVRLYVTKKLTTGNDCLPWLQRNLWLTLLRTRSSTRGSEPMQARTAARGQARQRVYVFWPTDSLAGPHSHRAHDGRPQRSAR